MSCILVPLSFLYDMIIVLKVIIYVFLSKHVVSNSRRCLDVATTSK